MHDKSSNNIFLRQYLLQTRLTKEYIHFYKLQDYDGGSCIFLDDVLLHKKRYAHV